MKLTFGLLNDFITIIKHGGIIKISWTNEKGILTTDTITEYTGLDELMIIPSYLCRDDFYVQFSNEEMSLDDALDMINKE